MRIASLLLMLSMLPLATALADGGSVPTGAPPGSELDKLLQAQGLTTADLESNRAGQVSDREAAHVQSLRSYLMTVLLVVVGVLVLGSVGVAVWKFQQTHRSSIFILPAIFGAVALVIAIIFLTALQVPSVKGRKVTVVEGEIAGYLPTYMSMGYVARINGVKYTGVAPKLPPMKGRNVKAYIVPELKMIVGLEPR